MAILFREDGKEVNADPSQIDILLKAGYSRTKPEPVEKADGKKAEDKQPANPENKLPTKSGAK